MDNFISELNKVDIDFFKKIAKNLKKRQDDEQQLTSYEDMLNFAQRNLINLDKIALVGLAHMAYGWMPTMIKHTVLASDFSGWKLKIKNGSLEKSFLKEIMKLTNESIVGASKLLHFLNPNDYPIYDSKVYSSIVNHDCKVNLSKDVENYVKYAEKLRNLVKNTNQNDILDIQKKLFDKKYIPQKCTPIRVLEVCLYAKQ